MKKILIILAVFVGVLFITMVKFQVYINLYSDSMPRGLYRRIEAEPQKGSIVASCLTKEVAKYGLERNYLIKGHCETGIQPVMKRIYAVKRDVISIINGQLAINEKILPNFPILEKDSRGRPVKRFYEDSYTLNEKEFWLMSDYKMNSWDSRYWGSVPILFILEPIFCLKGKK